MSWVGVAGLAVGLVVGISQHDSRAITYLAIHLCAALAVLLASRRPDLLTALFVLAMDLNAPGWAWRWLDVIWNYDKLAHFFVTMALTPLVARWLLRPLRAELLAHRVVLAVVLIALGMAANVLWEIYEWTSDHFIASPNMGIVDTMEDLISDTLGAMLSVPFGIYGLRRAGAEPGRRAP